MDNFVSQLLFMNTKLLLYNLNSRATLFNTEMARSEPQYFIAIFYVAIIKINQELGLMYEYQNNNVRIPSYGNSN